MSDVVTTQFSVQTKLSTLLKEQLFVHVFHFINNRTLDKIPQQLYNLSKFKICLGDLLNS